MARFNLELPVNTLAELDKKHLSNEQLARIYLHYKDNPHAWWTSTGAQQAFIDDLSRIGNVYTKRGRELIEIPRDKADVYEHPQRCRHALLLGCNMGGKTATMVNIINGLVHDKVFNPWLKQSRFFTDTSWMHGFAANGRPRIFVLLKKDVVQRVFTPEMLRWTPKGTYETEKGDKGYNYLWRFSSGAEMFVATADQDVGQTVGTNLDVVLTDDMFVMHFYGELLRGLRGRGAWLSFMTPALTLGKDANDFINLVMEMPEELRIVHTTDKESACRKHGTRGWRPHSDIAEEIRSCPPGEEEARIFGRPMFYAGKVYKNFSYNLHVKKDEEIVRILKHKKFTIYGVCDYHENRPPYIAWCALTFDEQWFWIAEWPEWDASLSGEPIEERNQLRYYLRPRMMAYGPKMNSLRVNPSLFAQIVMAKEAEIEAKYGLPVFARFLDPRFGARKPDGGVSIFAQLSAAGTDFFPAVAEKNIGVGHSAVRTLIDPVHDDKGTMIQAPAMFWSMEAVPNMIRMIANHSYRADMKKGGFTGRLSEDTNDDFKEGSDCARYLVMRNPMYVEAKPVQEGETIRYDYWGKRVKSGRNTGLFAGM